EERESAHLDALPRSWVWWGSGVFERRVGREARAAVFLGIEYFEDQRFIAPHLGKIKPAMLRVVLQAVSLSHAMRIASLGHDQVVHLYFLGMDKSKSFCLVGFIDPPPYLNDSEPVS